MDETAETRIRLRPLELDDIDDLVASHDGDPASFAPPGDQGRERLRKQIERRPTLEDGGFLHLAIEADGRLVGDIQARAPKNAFPPGVCELGITLFADVRGRGVGREAVALLTEQLFAAGWERVQASTSVDNVAMRRVLERLGWELEGVLRSYSPAEGEGREDYAMYAATRSERTAR
jgi:RimJ/RimL family protein N-acetyltransferase